MSDVTRELFSVRTLVLTGLLAIVAVGYHAMKPAVLQPVGPYSAPVQQPLDLDLTLAAPDGYTIVPTDTYEVDALILSRARYRWDREADLSPVDFLLGWGVATTEPTLSAVHWSQSGRWGFWQWGGELPIAQRTLENNVANTHIIPDYSDPSLRDELLSLGRGDAVHLSGYLVRITGEDGYRWQSSRSRSDTGDGSCEVFYVTYFERK